jgi:prepilin-type N-terminal cleavage/methylation domain-containing protein
MRNLRSQGCKLAGFTLIEIVITMIIVLVMALIFVPLLVSYVVDARIAKARADVRAIGEAILRFERDTGRFPMFSSGSGFLPDSSANVVRMEGAGLTPYTNPASDWTRTAGFTDSDCAASCTFHTMGVLLSNDIGYPVTSSLGKPFKWKGPYIAVTEDPWGYKYLVNIINAKSSSTGAVIVVSAGPDGTLQTNFNPLRTTTNVGPATSDDITYRIR